MTDGHGDGAVVSPKQERGARVVTEVSVPGAPPRVEHPEWREAMPWLAQGTTARWPDGTAYNMGLFGATPVRDAMARWAGLRAATGCPRAVHSRQVHGAAIAPHERTGPGLFVGDGHDGHVTSTTGLLLTVSIADCVPAFLVDPRRRAVALVHAGWRGVARGVLESGIAALAEGGSQPAVLLLHLGPAICGECYEVGAEVFEALGEAAPAATAPIDLRGVLATRALAAGLGEAGITVSAHCARCERRGPRRFHSHRAGDPERQIAYLGLRA